MQNPFKGAKNPFKDVKNPFPHLKGRKLYRSPRDGIVFGVCAGLAAYLQVDPVFVRLITVVLAFFSGGWPIVVAYIAAAFLVPIDPAQDSVASHQAPKDVTPEKKHEAKEEKHEEKHEAKEGKMDSDQNM